MVAYLPKVISARERSSVVGKVLGLVAGGDVEGACDNLQVCQDQLPGFPVVRIMSMFYDIHTLLNVHF